GRQRLPVDFRPSDRPRPLGLPMLPPSEAPIIRIHEVLRAITSKGCFICVAPALLEDHESCDPPLEMSGLSRRLNNDEGLPYPLLRHRIEACFNHFAP